MWREGEGRGVCMLLNGGCERGRREGLQGGRMQEVGERSRGGEGEGTVEK